MKTNNTLAAQRRLAKAGMVAALGTLVGTGIVAHAFSRRRTHLARSAHVAAGVAMVGLSWWHWSLHRNRAEKAAGKDAYIPDDATVRESVPDAEQAREQVQEQAQEQAQGQAQGQARAKARDTTRSKTRSRARKEDGA